MCVCLGSFSSFIYIYIYINIYTYIHIYMHTSVYMYTFIHTRARTHTHTHTRARAHTHIKVRSPDGDTEYFDIVAGVLQGDTLDPYLFIICLDYVLRTSIDKIRENGFELTKKRSKRYPAKTITDADYADDIALLANTPNQAETLLHSLERAAACIGLHVTKLNICVTTKQATLPH